MSKTIRPPRRKFDLVGASIRKFRRSRKGGAIIWINTAMRTWPVKITRISPRGKSVSIVSCWDEFNGGKHKALSGSKGRITFSKPKKATLVWAD